jgi:hypothetical protein
MADNQVFGSDRPLLYDIAPWNSLGFGVPNFSNQIGTLSLPIHRLADEIAKVQLTIMTHIDAQRTQYPSINTIQRLGKMLNRVKAILANRQKGATDLRVEEGHASADKKPWLIHPVPFFDSGLCQNSWLNEYNRLCMIALTNIYQHSDNNLALTITDEFAAYIWQYFREIALLVGTELLGLQAATILTDAFVFDDTAYAGYATIADRVMSFEPLDTPGPIQSRPDEVDLGPLFRGIPANLIVTSLAAYPVGAGGLGAQGTAVPATDGPVGAADGTGTDVTGGHIGEPQV